MLILDALSKPKDAIPSISIPEKIKGKSRAMRISKKYSGFKNVISYFCSSASKVLSYSWMLMLKCQVPTLTLYLVSLCMVCTIQLCINVHGTVWQLLVSILVYLTTFCPLYYNHKCFCHHHHVGCDVQNLAVTSMHLALTGLNSWFQFSSSLPVEIRFVWNGWDHRTPTAHKSFGDFFYIW